MKPGQRLMEAQFQAKTSERNRSSFGRRAVAKAFDRRSCQWLTGSRSLGNYSDQLDRPVQVAMIAMGMMEGSVDQIVDVITVRDRFVPAVRTMNMA
jgi:hypothetical protein